MVVRVYLSSFNDDSASASDYNYKDAAFNDYNPDY
jgi:hypothetical protein